MGDYGDPVNVLIFVYADPLPDRKKRDGGVAAFQHECIVFHCDRLMRNARLFRRPHPLYMMTISPLLQP